MSKKAFVLMPFSDDLSEVYEFLIKSALEDANYSVKRADDIKSQSNIIEDIVHGIMDSDLIIADLTDSNPNVYYELGIAHALQKNVVLITQEIEELPFDLRSYRVIGYATHFSRMSSAKKELTAIAIEAFNDNLPFGNPVKDYGLGYKQADSNITRIHDPKNNNDLGILDYQIQIEDGFEALTSIVNDVGDKMSLELVPKIESTTESLSSNQHTSKQKRNIISELAEHMQNYSNFIKPRNDIYRQQLLNIETSIEYLLNKQQTGSIETFKDLAEFLESLEAMKSGAMTGRQSFSSLLETQKNLPNMEKNFNRANKNMQLQLEQFVQNIDQTIAIASRAILLGNSILPATTKTDDRSCD